MLVRSKIVPQFVEKIKELKPNLSKQHNEMLKIKSEMLKIRKIGEIIKLEKNFPGISRIPRIFGIPGIFLKIFRFAGS